MTKHLRKVPASFDPPDDSASDDAGADASPDGPVAPPSDVAVSPAARPRSGDDRRDGAARA